MKKFVIATLFAALFLALSLTAVSAYGYNYPESYYKVEKAKTYPDGAVSASYYQKTTDYTPYGKKTVIVKEETDLPGYHYGNNVGCFTANCWGSKTYGYGYDGYQYHPRYYAYDNDAIFTPSYNYGYYSAPRYHWYRSYWY